MDLDAELKALRTFKQRLEKLFDGGLLERLEAAAAAIGGADTTVGEDLATRVTELEEHVTAVQQAFDGVQGKIETAVAEHMGPQRLETLDRLKGFDAAQLAAVAKLADPAVLDLIDWLARNREAIDVLLSLGETTDGEDDSDEAEEEPTGAAPGGPDAPHPSDPEPAPAGS